jgi:DNA-binding MarR family transcriptional regulator
MFNPLSKPGLLIRRLHQISVRLFESFTPDLAMSAVQYGVLEVIVDNPGIDQASLTQTADVDRTTGVRLVDRLVDLGLVRREVCPEDRRVRRLHATPLAEPLINKTREDAEASQRELLSPLSAADRKEFMRLLRVLVSVHTEQGHALHEGGGQVAQESRP